ncbi:unnamed protein product [Diatraea saccharalis]|uniref:WKF domain-containing protein n=1 Tax=Diatraea saccharalis TaxID=40085 RepID=A0A9N9WHY6_9NEOP|nr:unnamed protein product [Diatraea saccharalis]
MVGESNIKKRKKRHSKMLDDKKEVSVEVGGLEIEDEDQDNNGSKKKKKNKSDNSTVQKKRVYDTKDVSADAEGLEIEDEDNKGPKKKKKKKNKPDNSTVQSNKNKSIRQIKREKFAQRQAESLAAAKEQTKSECLNYLSQWKYHRQNWKFMKAKQVWLYKNKFSENLVPKESWSLLLEYFESAKGNIRNMLLDDANKIIKQMDDWTESQTSVDKNEEENEVTENELKKPSEAVYKRARDLIQFLQE